MKLRTVSAICGILILSLGRSDSAPAKPMVWLCPPGFNNGQPARELFEHPDEWTQTRSMIDVMGFADHNLQTQFTDQELSGWLAMLKKWNIKLGLEVGAVKPWGTTGAKVFGIEEKEWDRVQRLGGNVYAVAMDEPLTAVRYSLKQPDAYAVQETAAFIALVRQHYPNMIIGDIEPYPSITLADHIAWIQALNQRLAALNVRGIDFYRVDVNWTLYTVFGNGSWLEVKKLEDYCHSIHLPFSLIYWAADWNRLNRFGVGDDTAWYCSLMQQGYDYALLQAAPDQYVIQSWDKCPSVAVPETQEYSFTRGARDFLLKIVYPPPAPAQAAK